MGYLVLATVAAVGLVASVGCHALGWLGYEPPGGKPVFVALHLGIFVVWVPLVFSANRTMPPGARNNLDHLLAEVPRWARGLVALVFAYAIVNFATFLVATQAHPRKQVPVALELRGFSGHWMMFYGWAWVGFVGLARLRRKRRAGD